MSPAHATPRAEPKPKRGSVRPILSLAFAAIFPLTAHLVAPRVALGEAATNAVTFLGGALTALVPLSLASAARISIRVRVALGLASAMTLATIALRGAHGLTASLFVDLALVTLALAIGGGIGERVEHPGHLLPACVVAFVPEARRLRPKDQRTAQVAIVIAIAVAIGVLLRRGS